MLLLLVVLGCRTKTTNTGNTSNIKTDGANGTSYDNMIVIQAQNEFAGVRAENQWLEENYPGYQSIQQSVTKYNGKPVDIFKIKTKEGKTLEIYFDISSFFGKI